MNFQQIHLSHPGSVSTHAEGGRAENEATCYYGPITSPDATFNMNTQFATFMFTFFDSTDSVLMKTPEKVILEL